MAVTGAAGMIGRKLVARLVADGGLSDGVRELAIERLSLYDVVEPAPIEGWFGPVDRVATDLGPTGAAEAVVAGRPDVIFHLAAVVSGEAEADFDKGYRVNLDGTRDLLEAIRRAHLTEGYTPRLVFTSSIAVYGAPLPDRIPDAYPATPRTSYGTQKAIDELLLADYTRRGFVDGVGIRLPTICIRPGRPNLAASGFFSSILREPLAGQEAVLPVPEDVRHWFASPRSAVGFLLRAATIDSALIGPDPTLAMPGVSATVGEQIGALRRIAGDAAVALIRREPDPAIARIVAEWAPGLEARRARELGFTADASMEEIIRAHIDDELGGTLR
ncbi:SDR family oxidoreductase [Microlunatus ginsengisoli]|uniref:SDR family oxidoreductase n=1 Tax=Microlunatus ginsengisoli TaxID=363863 RepID=A0ABP6ZTK5_9ACTN